MVRPAVAVLRARPLPRSAPAALRALMAASFGFAAMAAGYAWVRAIETWMFPRVDPRAIVAVTQSGYVTRCGVAVLVGGMGAFAGWALGSRAERGARGLVIAIAVTVAAVALQVGLAP